MTMNRCVSPPELDEHLLLRYLDGERNADVMTHLNKCSFCRERGRKLAQLQNRLAAQLYRLTCPTSIELGDYLLDLLPGSQSQLIAKHLRECPHCTKEIAQLKDYIMDLSPAAKPGLLDQARVIIARMIGGIQPGELLSGQLGGAALAPAYATLRGGDQGPITLQADGILIILEIEPAAEGRIAVIGQLASDEQDSWIAAKVELFENGELLASDSLSDIGAFRFEGILPGAVELKITPRSGPIVLANIAIAT